MHFRGSFASILFRGPDRKFQQVDSAVLRPKPPSELVPIAINTQITLLFRRYVLLDVSLNTKPLDSGPCHEYLFCALDPPPMVVFLDLNPSTFVFCFVSTLHTQRWLFFVLGPTRRRFNVLRSLPRCCRSFRLARCEFTIEDSARLGVDPAALDSGSSELAPLREASLHPSASVLAEAHGAVVRACRLSR